jgi:predicted NAD/FAD-dependent oxidoreductase
VKTTADVLIVGAGLSGLIAARKLAAERRDVIVIDKGRGVGGRMSTRRHADARFDHGAQFITVRSDEFSAIVDEWVAAGVAELWSHGFADGQTGDGSIVGEAAAEHMPARDGHPRYRGVPSMSAIPKHLAANTYNLDIRLGVQAESVQTHEAEIRVRPTDGPDFHAQCAILTPPVPQTLSLLANGGVALQSAQQQALSRLEYNPCLVLLSLSNDAIELPEPGVLRRPSKTIDWMADNARKGVTDRGPALTVHFSADFSRTHYEDDPSELLELLITETQKVIPLSPLEPQLKKWRFSQPANPSTEGAAAIEGAPGLILAGDVFSGARVEGAVLSGLAAAEKALHFLNR